MAKKEAAPVQVQNITDPQERAKALEAAKLQIEKQFGKGSIQRLGEEIDALEIDTIP
ncbi:MAG: DNA recombination/repair protein RecA, partial [Spirochaetaceae bacterium]|nr:DNA recombination/repair protein RecA [Spirochaetaceae bacterium]